MICIPLKAFKYFYQILIIEGSISVCSRDGVNGLSDSVCNSADSVPVLVLVSWFWFVWFYGISTFVGYLTPNPFLCK